MTDKKKVILAIDQGSENMGWCVIDFEKFIKEEREFECVESKQVKLCNSVNKLWSERITNFENEMINIKNKYEVIEVIVEQPQLIRWYQGRSVINGKSYRLLWVIGSILKHFDWVWECQNNSWYSKIFKMGRRNDKSQVRKIKARELAAENTNKDFEEVGNDECDAVCIAYWWFLFDKDYRTKKLVNNIKMLKRYKTDTNEEYYNKISKTIIEEKKSKEEN